MKLTLRRQNDSEEIDQADEWFAVSFTPAEDWKQIELSITDIDGNSKEIGSLKFAEGDGGLKLELVKGAEITVAEAT